jgi:hypothetical protein
MKALFSPCGKYRYWLHDRVLMQSGLADKKAAWIMHYEVFSEDDLTRSGVYRNAEHPSTEIIKVLRKLPPFDYQTKSELDELLETY